MDIYSKPQNAKMWSWFSSTDVQSRGANFLVEELTCIYMLKGRKVLQAHKLTHINLQYVSIVCKLALNIPIIEQTRCVNVNILSRATQHLSVMMESDDDQ